jgi:hypothetical protein
LKIASTTRRLLSVVLLFVNATVCVAADEAGGIQPYAKNPRYWQYHGQPVLLLGGSEDDNLFQLPNLREHLDAIQAAGGNYIRNTMSDRPDRGFEVYAYARGDSGKFDLSEWNDEYWTRFENMLRWTHERQIFVQIEVWDRFDFFADNWQAHPFNPANNVNYTAEQSGLAARYPDHPGQNKQPLFFTTPQQRNNRLLLEIQQRFVAKMLSHALKYDHVLYCMDNETSAEEGWGAYWAEFIRTAAAKAGNTVHVTEMWDDWNLQGPHHRRTLDHPERYGFVDVSQNNHNRGQKHWENFQWVCGRIAAHPRPINTVKTYGADGGRFGNSRDGVERFWRHVIGGVAAARFHRPDAGLGFCPPAVASLAAARRMESLIRLWDCQPALELLSDRDANEAYATAQPGHGYIVYFPAGGQVQLSLADAPSEYTLHWISIRDGAWGDKKPQRGGARVQLASPDNSGWLAVLTRNAE